MLPGLIRLDVIDRQGGGVRTVATQSEPDYVVGRNVLDSVALFGGKVYWIDARDLCRHDRHRQLL